MFYAKHQPIVKPFIEVKYDFITANNSTILQNLQ